ncbi:MAG: PhoU domain-containing protein [Candidatus Methanomethylicaceae archaeon]|nr:PhoU domain-containing protein [Candidatus Verstraetearchaeota archaeon]
MEDYLNRIDSIIMEMYDLVENMGNFILKALEERKSGLLELTNEICKVAQIKEEKVLEICIEVLIRFQPFASDLRKLTTSMKVAYDISRICRYLRNIIEVMEEFDLSNCDIDETILLFKSAFPSVLLSINSYLQKDVKKSKDIIKADEFIDQKYKFLLRKLVNENTKPSCILFNGLVARIIERMADHACYIAHETIYLVTGNRIEFFK